MKQTLSALHPNPGWSNVKADVSTDLKSNDAIDMIGKHCLLELYECDQNKLDDEAFIRDTMTIAAKKAGATLLQLITHKFKPQGVTGMALLAESHISIHTWPELGYAAIDVFTCGNHTMPNEACECLRTELKSRCYSFKSFLRETPAALSSQVRTPISII